MDGLESVWDYPRPPRLDQDSRSILITHHGQILAQAPSSVAMKETSHPPCYYISPDHVSRKLLKQSRSQSWCEFKGRATYWSIVNETGGLVAPDVAWTYDGPTPAYTDITGYFCFYASRVERCVLGGVDVTAQEGDFYGGWITPEIAGPFKGGPGTRGW